MNTTHRPEERPLVDERDLYIPLRHGDLIRRLAEELALEGEERQRFDSLCQKLVALFHVEHLAALIEVEDLYAPLDPDGEVVDLTPDAPGEVERNVEAILDRLSSLLHAAHYEQLSQQVLEEAIEVGGAWNVRLDVDFSVFDRLLVFARGYRRIQLTRRRWHRFFREESIEIPEFQRLVLVFRLKAHKRVDPTLRTDVLYLKVFKNIPESELEVLLPGSRVRFSLLDQGKILLPTLSGAALIAYKIIKGALALTFLTFVAIWQWVVMLLILGGYLVRSFFSYLGTRNKYQLGLTRNLYLKNLDNNSGVIYRIFSEAEEQELGETLLAYAVLLQRPVSEATSEPELTELCEHFLLRVVGRELRFDLHDALGKLIRLGLIESAGADRWRAVPLERAPGELERNWGRLFTRGRGLWSLDRLFEGT
ncbi:MAG: TMEM143 family protein [Planctomycetota bacterium]|jgi:hypothetical protein